jgi:uncharacterized protein (TIGR02145 family)
MKRIFLTMTALFMLSAIGASAQVTIGELKDPESFSILELVSTDRGLRLPQMSNANKIDAFGSDNATLTAAGDDALGLQIFNLDTHPEYGLLYNWATASGRTGAGTDSEGIGSTPPTTPPTGAGDICPDGWHLPSDYEWTQLENEITNNNTNNKYGTGSDIGHNIKSTTPVDIYISTGGTSNPYSNNGFNALLVGCVYDGNVFGYGSIAHFWSSSSCVVDAAWLRLVNNSAAEVVRFDSVKFYLFSVRCKKNE